MEDDFIGTTFPTPKGGVLTVVSWDGERCGSSKIYTLSCNICSKDTELYPEKFKSEKGKILKGGVPCGCSKKPNWKEHHYSVRVKRECKNRGYIFHGWSGDFKGSQTKLSLENPNTGSVWKSTSIYNFLSGSGDPQQALLRHKLPDKTHIEDFHKAGFTRDYKFFRNKDKIDGRGFKVYWDYVCPVCSVDEYVKVGLCSGVFSAHRDSLKAGSKSCRCNNTYRWTQEQKEYQINKICKEEDLSFIGWLGDYENNESKFRWVCQKGHDCITSINNFLCKGIRCNTCWKVRGIFYGYYPERIQESDILYILNFDNQYIKIGRSFDIDRRIKQLKKESNITTIDTLYLIKGTHQEIYNLEQFLHTELRDRGFEYETDWGSIECFDLDSLKLTYKLVDEELADNNSLEEGMTKLYL